MQGMANGKAMELLLQKEENVKTTLAGVQFEDSLTENQPLPKNVYVAIRFPAELRKPPLGEIMVKGKSWQTDLVFPIFQIAGPRSYISNETAPPGKYASSSRRYLKFTTSKRSILWLLAS